MAVDSLTPTTEGSEFKTFTVIREETTEKTRDKAVETSEFEDTTTTGSLQNIQDTTTTATATKNEKLIQEARELLNHLYSTMENNTIRKCCLYSARDEESSASENDDFFECDDYYLKCDSYELVGRKKNNYRRAKRERKTKEQKFAEFCREYQSPECITLEKGRKKAIRVKYSRCVKQMARDSNRRDHNERRKENIEKKFEKLGLKRRQYTEVRTENYGLHPNAKKYQLRKENAPKEMSDIVDFLMALQDREVTPEDYDFLLKLDELIPKKTVSEECLGRLKEDTVDGSHVEDICGICMENYEIGQIRKILPCQHMFHANCIEQWLSQSSTKCPLDGLEI